MIISAVLHVGACHIELEGMGSSKKRGVGGEKRKENNKEAIWEFMKNLLENLWCNFKWL